MKQKFNPKTLLYITLTVFIVISLALLYVQRGVQLTFFTPIETNDKYMDFFNHIAYVENPSTVYTVSPHACFPPLAYVFYFICNRILPVGSVIMFNANATTPYALLLYVFYIAILSVLFFYAVKKLLVYSDKESLLITVLIMFSNIFIFGILERGNAAFIVAILLLLALSFMRSKNKPVRELALILIAVAAGIKLYPAVFGLIYIKEKRFKEACRLIVYGLCAFFIPFAFFGGIDGLKQFFANSMQIQNICTGTPSSSIPAAFSFFGESFGNASLFSTLGTIVTVIFLCVALFVFFNKYAPKWQGIMMLSSVMVIVPHWSGMYTKCYFVLPLILFINQMSIKVRKIDYIYALLFSAMFAFITINPQFDEWRYIVIYIMIIIILSDSISLYSVSRKSTVLQSNQ